MSEEIIKWGNYTISWDLVPYIILIMKDDSIIPLYIAQIKTFTEPTLQIRGH